MLSGRLNVVAVVALMLGFIPVLLGIILVSVSIGVVSGGGRTTTQEISPPETQSVETAVSSVEALRSCLQNATDMCDCGSQSRETLYAVDAFEPFIAGNRAAEDIYHEFLGMQILLQASCQ